MVFHLKALISKVSMHEVGPFGSAPQPPTANTISLGILVLWGLDLGELNSRRLAKEADDEEDDICCGDGMNPAAAGPAEINEDDEDEGGCLAR